MQKSRNVSAIMVLAVFQAVLAWGFYAAFAFIRPQSSLLPGILIAASAYTAALLPVGLGVRQRQLLWVRGGFLLAIIASIPVKAIIGIVLSAIALGLTTRASVKAWFDGAGLSA